MTKNQIIAMLRRQGAPFFDVDDCGNPSTLIIEPRAARRAAGVAVVNGQEMADTLQCPHCAKHFWLVKGSKKKRHFCMGCMAPTCNEAACRTCVPWQKKLEFAERKR
jgi:hypothetical protein